MVVRNPKLSVLLAKSENPEAAGQVVELKITLRYIKPRIWRTFVVPAGIKLNLLHDVIQAVMGWTDSHLHSFRVGHCEYLQSVPEDAGWQQMIGNRVARDERKHTLRDLINEKGDKFAYLYDFGDDWEHEVKVKSIHSPEEPLEFAFCRDGARACPPEDCGGAPGYLELVEALPNRKHPQHEYWTDWIDNYDPTQFDCDYINRRLHGIRM